ncbi:MAG: carbon-nitrogen hydrolase family protein [Gammaproteobacteria bacterium]
MTKFAAIQMASGSNVSSNLIEARRLIQGSSEAGAKVIVLPENFAIMGMTEHDKITVGEDYGTGPIQDFLAKQAKDFNVWIIAGTIPILTHDKSRIRASSLVYNSDGLVIARYDKIHLFDVDVPESTDTYRESETIEAGTEICVFDSPFGKIGIGICYDLRFPELFRKMAEQEVEILIIPSAFTAITGKAHWEILLKSRAIENLCYVVASAQGGYHVNGRETHGHSTLIDPWGSTLEVLPSGSGFVIADLDLTKINNIRKTFPVLQHRQITT